MKKPILVSKNYALFAPFFAALLAATSSSAIAANYSTVGSGNWDTSTNWSPTGVPDPTADNITINGGFSINAFNVPPMGFNSVTLDNGHTLLIDGAGSTLTSHDYVLSGVSTTTVQNSGVLNLNGYLFGGNSFDGGAGAASTLNVNAAVVWVAGSDFGAPPVRGFTGTQIGLTSNFVINITNGGQYLIFDRESGWVKLGMSSGVTGTLIVDGSGSIFSRDYSEPTDLNRVENITVGDTGGGTGNIYLKNGGTLTDNQNLFIAPGGGSTGTVIVGGDNNGAAGTGFLNIAKQIFMGDGASNFIHHSGTTTTGTAGVGGAFRVGFGNGANANATINGGTVNVGGELSIAENGGSTGTVNLNGGITSVDYVIVGAGTGLLNMNGGVLRANMDDGNFFRSISSAQSEIQAGGAFFDTNAHNITIGTDLDGVGGLTKQGLGTLTLTGNNTYAGATNVTGGSLNIQNGSALGSITGGTVVSSGAALQVQGGITVTGEALTISGTGVASDGALQSVSGNNSFNGNITLGADAQINSQTVGDTLTLDPAIGNAISGGFNVTFAGPGNFAVGPIANGGDLNMNGTGVLLLNTNNTYMPGDTNINAGTVRIGGPPGPTDAIPDLSAVTIAAGATLDLNGHDETIGSLSGAPGSFVTLGTGTLTTNGNNDSTTFSGVISGSGGLTKEGTGVLILDGLNTYTGATTVNGGQLIVNGSISGTTSIVVTGGSIGGSGDLGGAGLTVSGGVLSPDGILSTGSIDFAGGTLSLDIHGLTPGSGPNDYDQLDVTGSVTLSVNTPLTIDLGGFDPLDDGSQMFTIINNDLSDGIVGPGLFTVGGTPIGNNGTFNIGGQIFAINYAGGDGNDVVLTALPEPGSVTLMLVGFGALAGLQRRRRNRV